MKARELETRIRDLLAAQDSDQELRSRLEELAREPAFSGFTWLWGPALYERNRVLFRPFILSHFDTWFHDPPRTWKPVNWTGSTGKALKGWLERVDLADDVELFKRLYPWKRTPPGRWRLDEGAVRRDLVKRFTDAPSSATRGLVLAKFELWFALDEDAACALYEHEPALAAPYILRHLPVAWSFWGGQMRTRWNDLSALASRRGDSAFRFALYRRQVPIAHWEQDVAGLCDTLSDPDALCAALQQRHPEGLGLELGNAFFRLVQKRGQDVFPYVQKHLRQVGGGQFFRGGYGKMLDLARKKGWWGLWAALLRICSRPKEYNRELLGLLRKRSLEEDEVRRRLLMLAGVSREWNLAGFGLAQLNPLDEDTALELHCRFPDLLRGPFSAQVALTWGQSYPRLIDRLMAQHDDLLLDYMASRAITRIGGSWGDKTQLDVVDKLAAYYELLRGDPVQFCQRACAVLGQIPAYAIYSYSTLIQKNRLARLMFERSASFFLQDPGSMQDLVEASEIHVQALAYRALALDNDRARALATANLELLMGTLLRPLHRKTRTLAFGALANAATTLEHARRVHRRAREALDLPEMRYPKEKLIGLIALLLSRWPELRSDGEQPIVFGAVSQ